jgi:hypothetical protein
MARVLKIMCLARAGVGANEKILQRFLGRLLAATVGPFPGGRRRVQAELKRAAIVCRRQESTQVPSAIIRQGIVRLTFVGLPEFGDDPAAHITLRSGHTFPGARH